MWMRFNKAALHRYMTRKIEAKIGDINAKQKSGTPKILGCVAKMHFAHDGCHD